MGVVNVTPDSFSDGGCFLEPAAAIAHGRRLHAEGADIVDVGGESTRPGAAPVPAADEIGRVLPVVEALAASGILVSIDSRKAEVMRAAVAAGARMINDVTALRHDPDSLEVAGASGCLVVLMHSQGEPATMQRQPTYVAAALDVFDHLEQRAPGLGRGRLRPPAPAGRSRHRLRQDGRAQRRDPEPARPLSRPWYARPARSISQEFHRAAGRSGPGGRALAGIAGGRARRNRAGRRGRAGARCRRDPTMLADLASLVVLGLPRCWAPAIAILEYEIRCLVAASPTASLSAHDLCCGDGHGS